MRQRLEVVFVYSEREKEKKEGMRSKNNRIK